MLIMTEKGLYCPSGNFYIDPKRAVEHAVITHAHSDHARKGSKRYYCTTSGVSLLKARLGANIHVSAIPYREPFLFNDVKLSFHPAGHILGSSQIRLELNGEVWVVSGDYKREWDSTCERFEPLSCDVFITEATFGEPHYCWDKDQDVGQDIFDWWQTNAQEGFASVLYAYSLGKAQRVLSLLDSHSDKVIYCAPETSIINNCYREENIRLPTTICLSEITAKTKLAKELLIVPPTFLKKNADILDGVRYRSAHASGWTSDNGFRQGFTLSDHADWNDLIRTITETNAKRVYVQHRNDGILIKKLNSLGMSAYHDSDLCVTEPEMEKLEA